MGIFEFIAALVKNLAWPLVVVGSLALFRSPIFDLIGSVTKISHGDTAVEFDRKSREVKAALAFAKTGTSPDFTEASELIERPNTNTNIGRIVSAWSELESIVRQRLLEAGVEKAATMSGSNLLVAARVKNLLTTEQLNSLKGLNAMRNLAVHGRASEIDESRTQEFLVLAEAITTVLDMTKPQGE